MDDEYDDDAVFTEADVEEAMRAAFRKGVQAGKAEVRGYLRFATLLNGSGASIVKALDALEIRKGQWDESKHARDHGKFASTPGGDGGKAAPSGDELQASKIGKTLHPNVQIRHHAGGDWVVKGRHGKRAAVENEVLASGLARSLGLNVPQVHHAKMYGQDQAVVEHVAGRTLSHVKDPAERKELMANVPREEIDRHALFDYLIGSSDPNSGNYMVGDDGTFVALDKEQSLRYGEIKDRTTYRIPFFLEDAQPAGKAAGDYAFAPDAVAEMADAGEEMAAHLKAIGRAADARGVANRAAVLKGLAARGEPITAAEVAAAGEAAYNVPTRSTGGLLGRVRGLFGG